MHDCTSARALTTPWPLLRMRMWVEPRSNSHHHMWRVNNYYKKSDYFLTQNFKILEHDYFYGQWCKYHHFRRLQLHVVSQILPVILKWFQKFSQMCKNWNTIVIIFSNVHQILVFLINENTRGPHELSFFPSFFAYWSYKVPFQCWLWRITTLPTLKDLNAVVSTISNVYITIAVKWYIPRFDKFTMFTTLASEGGDKI